jgi:hypothetical protein
VSSSTRSSNSSSQGNGVDERFAVPIEASRRGAHRARVSPVMAALPIVAVVAVVVGAIALVYVFFNGLGGSGTTSEATATATTGAPAASGSQAAPGTASTSPSASGTVNKKIPVAVYNGTNPSVTGLARKAAGKLTAEGFTLGTVAPWTGSPVTETTIFIGSEEQRPTAEAIAAVFGKGVVSVSSVKAGVGITVVVSNDFPGIVLPTKAPATPRPSHSASHSPTSKSTASPSPTQSTETTASVSPTN